MSYPRDLEEHSDAELIEEICSRIQRQESGQCTYCHKAVGTLPCKFPERHRGAEPHIFAAMFEEVRMRFAPPMEGELPDALANATIALLLKHKIGDT